jgi:Ca-activated chloride channel homolog
MKSVENDYYIILGIDRSATAEEIQHAYHNLARQYHPDTSQKAASKTSFLEIQEAYETLSDPKQRQHYDLLQEREIDHSAAFLHFKVTTSHSQLKAKIREQVFYAMLELKPVAHEEITRPELNLCLVFDRSTSMQGNRLFQLKQAASHIIDLLTPSDAFCLVIFSDRAEIVIPCQRDINKEKAKYLINSIQPGGGTEMLKGLSAGLNEMIKQQSANAASHLILLTDGQTYGDEKDCIEMAGWAQQHSIGISTLGVGADWNADLLDQISSKTGNHTTYIDTPDKIIAAFTEIITSLTALHSGKMKISFYLPRGVSISELLQISPYIQRFDPKSGSIYVGRMAHDERKIFLFELHILEQELGRQRLLHLTIEGDHFGKEIKPFCKQMDIFAHFNTEPSPENEISPVIINALGKLAIFKIQEKTMEDIETGRLSAATQRLETMATRLLNIGETELARAALLEAGRLARTGSLTAEGKKKIHYGTSSLSILPLEI